MEDASFTLEVRLLKTEVMDTLLYARVARNLGPGTLSTAEQHTKTSF